MSAEFLSNKVDILLHQKKYNEAEKLLKELLQTDVNNTNYLLQLGHLYMEQKRNDEAEKMFNNVIAISPDDDRAYYYKGHLYFNMDRYQNAEELAREAVRLDPQYAENYTLLANIQLARKEFESALENADRAVAIDPQSVNAINVRSLILTKLNRGSESKESIESSLQEDPHNEFTHANYGWVLLENGDHKKALVHFGEALRIDPNFENAQIGLIESMKAKNIIYRWFLKYSFWISNMSAQSQWILMLGFFFGFRILSYVSEKNELFGKILTPALVLLGVMALSTWLINPVSNLFLRFNKYGNLLLSKGEKLGSTLVGILLGIAIISGLIFLINKDSIFLLIAIWCIGMVIPCGMIHLETETPNLLYYITIALGLVGLYGIWESFRTEEFSNFYLSVFMFGVIGIQFFINRLVINSDKSV